MFVHRSGRCVPVFTFPAPNGRLSGVTFTFTPAAPGYFEYSATGNCAQTGTMTFTYAGRSKVLTIPNVGDPQIQ